MPLHREYPGEFQSWRAMRMRCHNPKCGKYPLYGGRGITVHPRWAHLRNFIEDMGPKPTRRHTIDRIDTNRGYEPGNCRWATNKEQARNRRNNRYLTLNGETRLLVDWASELGLSTSCLWARVVTMKWPLAKALGTPARKAA